MHPTHSGLPPSSSSKSWLLRLESLTIRGPPSAQSSFACQECYSCQGDVPHHLEGHYPSSSLLRAHAPNQFPPPDFVVSHLFPVVFAGCCEPLLGTASSRRYSASLSQDA